MKTKRRLLLADDSVTIQKVVHLTFADEDIEVIAVGDGDAAMQKFVEVAPDLVLADVNMPGFDGYRICEMIKRDEKTKHIPVVLLVGSFEPFDEAEARRVGADDFLTKPFQSIRLLINKVTDLLEGKAVDTNLRSPSEPAINAADDFDDLLKNEPDDELDSAEVSIENLGEAGMDDEMIQTAQPDEEIDEYESEPIIDAEPAAETIDLPPLKQSGDYRKPLKNLDDEDGWARTQPLSKKHLEETAADAGAKKNAPLLEAEDLDLLEFPMLAANTDSEPIELRPESEAAPHETPKTGGKAESEILEAANENTETTASLENVSPELIEAIVNKAVEKISSDVVREVVREVIAQMEKKK